jgi:hypothetical protein
VPARKRPNTSWGDEGLSDWSRNRAIAFIVVMFVVLPLGTLLVGILRALF